uniref:hypothetical protein n=1 Tax=Lactiplantibacillus pentosus TaxID=1589 RepID=UPI0020A7017C|nr:hypothetical protein [Lactiplantibacillus pentosus]
MKKRILIVLYALPLLILGLIASISFYAVNINSSPTTKQNVAAEPVVIYDKMVIRCQHLMQHLKN